MTDKKHTIFLVSDGTGETAEKAVRAILLQYRDMKIQMERFKSVRSLEQVESICEEAKRKNAMIVYTVVIENLRKSMREIFMKNQLLAVDLLGSLMEIFSQYLGERPVLSPGLLHQVNEDYFKRIEAIEFTVKHDDGNLVENLKKADIVLIGVSRTSKTPLSIYLSHKGYKVANVPLVKGIEPPKEIFDLNPKKIFCLTINPSVLTNIRRERMLRMGRDPTGDYCSLKNVQDEVDWAQQIYNRNKRWMVFDVTNKALEETAADIEKRMQSRFSIQDLAD